MLEKKEAQHLFEIQYGLTIGHDERDTRLRLEGLAAKLFSETDSSIISEAVRLAYIDYKMGLEHKFADVLVAQAEEVEKLKEAAKESKSGDYIAIRPVSLFRECIKPLLELTRINDPKLLKGHEFYARIKEYLEIKNQEPLLGEDSL